MTQSNKKILSILKINDRGWNAELFIDPTQITAALCQNCRGVCCDAVELGCGDHNDEDIYTYCYHCLTELICTNSNKCPISNHSKPSIIANRSTRRHILDLFVNCPYSVQYHQKMSNNKDVVGGQVVDTMGNDEKEGADNKNKEDIKGCKWMGKLSELINGDHLLHCSQQYHKCKSINVDADELNEIINRQSAIINKLKRENESYKLENSELREENQRLNELLQRNAMQKEEYKDDKNDINNEQKKHKKLIEQSAMIQEYMKTNKRQKEEKRNEHDQKELNINIDEPIFTDYSNKRWRLSKDNKIINGIDIITSNEKGKYYCICIGNNTFGYNHGIHCIAIKYKRGFYETAPCSIGVVSELNKDWIMNGINWTQKWPKVKYSYSYFDGNKEKPYWSKSSTIILKLDLNNWIIYYYKETNPLISYFKERVFIKKDDLEKNKTYYLMMCGNAYKDCFCEYSIVSCSKL